MEVVGLDHVQVAAPPGCEEDARRFFGGLLGLAELEKPAALGGQQLHIGVEEGHRPAAKAHPALAVRDLDALAARLEAAGVPVEWDSSLPGVRRFYAVDPWGNRIELVAAG